jgi:hypothetical protein
MLDLQLALDTLRMIYARLAGSPINWAVTGSLGMALQGLEVEVHDIDLQTDQAGAYAMESLLSEFVVTPVHYALSERIRSHLGKLEINGIQVEIIGSVQKRLEDGTWEEPVNVELYRRRVVLDEMRIPVLSLEYEYQAYLIMGRTEKAEMLRQWLQKPKAG